MVIPDKLPNPTQLIKITSSFPRGIYKQLNPQGISLECSNSPNNFPATTLIVHLRSL